MFVLFAAPVYAAEFSLFQKLSFAVAITAAVQCKGGLPDNRINSISRNSKDFPLLRIGADMTANIYIS